MQMCMARRIASTEGVDVESDTSSKVYRVYINRENTTVPNHCTCQGWVMTRNREAKKQGLSAKGISAVGLPGWCKHCEHINNVTCNWKQEEGEPYRIDGTCPKCKGPTWDEGLPDIAEGDTDALMHDLASMARELAGEEALPAYEAPKPEPFKFELVHTEGEDKFSVLVNDVAFIDVDLTASHGGTVTVWNSTGVQDRKFNLDSAPVRDKTDRPADAPADPAAIAADLLNGVK